MFRGFERQSYMVLRLVWRRTEKLPAIRILGLRLLHQLGLGPRVSRVLYGTPSASGSADGRVDQSILDGVSGLNSSTYGLLRPYPRPDERHFKRIESDYAEARARTDSKTRIVVLSAITGAYEAAPRHECLMSDARYVLAVDGPVSCESQMTELVQVDYFDVDPVRRARYVKTHPHLYAGVCDVIVWVDSNIIIRGDIAPIVDDFLTSGRPVGAIQHPLRADVYAEGVECITRKKDDAEVVEAHLARYRGIGFNTDQLVESNVLLLRMDHPKVRRFLARWWSEIERGSRRDQLSLNYAAENVGIDFHWIARRPNSVRNHPDFALIHHAANRLAGAQLRAPEQRAIVSPLHSRLEKWRSVHAEIVICVHNALEVTRACLASVSACRNSAFHSIILVDDGSNPETAEFLRPFAATEPGVSLVRHEAALGYTKAVNAGLRLTSGEFVVLLNSDTIVSANFIEKMFDAIRTTPGAGIVGPLSNAASTQSIPNHLSSATQTAVNRLPAGMSPGDMDLWCEANSPETYIRTPLIHGFCFGLTRDTITTIGEFDEKNFPDGYGEENDYCFRATDAGIGLVVAANTYVFHAKSKSYSREHRAQIVQVSNKRVAELHGEGRVRRSIINMQCNPSLIALREKAKLLYDQDSRLCPSRTVLKGGGLI